MHSGLRQLVSAQDTSPSGDSAPEETADSGLRVVTESASGQDSAPAVLPATGQRSVPGAGQNSASVLSGGQSSVANSVSGDVANPAPKSGGDQQPASGTAPAAHAASDTEPKSAPRDGRAPKSAPSGGPAPGSEPAPSLARSGAAPVSTPPPSPVLDSSPPHLIIILSSSPRSGSSLLGTCSQNRALTLAGTGHFASFDGTGGGAKANSASCQMVISEVRSMTQKSEKSGPDRTT